MESKLGGKFIKYYNEKFPTMKIFEREHIKIKSAVEQYKNFTDEKLKFLIGAGKNALRIELQEDEENYKLTWNAFNRRLKIFNDQEKNLLYNELRGDLVFKYIMEKVYPPSWQMLQLSVSVQDYILRHLALESIILDAFRDNCKNKFGDFSFEGMKLSHKTNKYLKQKYDAVCNYLNP
jgi:hypothetical protein